MAKTRFSRRKKVKKPVFDVAYRQKDEYIYSHIADNINDLILRPCDDGDRDMEVFSDFHGRGKVEEPVNEDGTVVIEHAVEVRQFLAACPHLDPTHALTLLEDNTMKEAIRIGQTQTMTPRGMIPNWVEKDLEDPLDQDFKKADAKAKKMEKEKLLLGEDYVSEPVRKIKDIRKEMIEAMDPAKIGECYTKIVWPVVVKPKVVQGPKKKMKKGKAKSKNGSKAKELTTKKVIKFCKKNLKADVSTTTAASVPAKHDAVKMPKELTKTKKTGAAKRKKIIRGKSIMMKPKKRESKPMAKENVIKYIKKKMDENKKGLNSAAGPTSVNGGASHSSNMSASVAKPALKVAIKTKSCSTTSTISKRPVKPPKVFAKKGSPGKENVTVIQKFSGAKKAMKARGDKKKKPVLNE
ncbi:hypothetical protein CAEBREN_07026 [Caenorhabditis brenneri]|uniref:Uncharacterized protein n=1 Tax=Caenorhabditis brenneri TaxID=135651 RepID=G0NLQ5_CAEBE|nr:hypothetical protein CAEBREN_07026 [Caenorhabditis brenneri]